MVEYGLIGRGLSHSFSADFFNEKFRREGIEARYLLFDIPTIDQFSTILSDHPSLRGLNVTSPYKREVMRYLDELSPEAAAIGAVNVIEFTADGKLRGHNTDWDGFCSTIPGVTKRAFIMGTGGAASAVALAFEKKGIDYSFVSRTPEKGQLNYEEMNAQLEDETMLINATPLGMYPLTDMIPDVDFSKINRSHFCYDLIYNPAETKFLKEAAKRGARTKNGLEMLKGQAVVAWKIWERSAKTR